MKKQSIDFMELKEIFYANEVPVDNELIIVEDAKLINDDELEISKLFSSELFIFFDFDCK